MMNRNKRFIAALLVMMLSLLFVFPALAAENAGTEPAAVEAELEAKEQASDSVVLSDTGAKAVACGVAIGLAAIGGTIAMGMATGKASDSMARQPEIQGNIRTTLMLGLVFIETAIIYALLVVILIIFVL